MKKLVTTYRAGAKKKVPRLLHFTKPKKLSRERVYELVREIVIKKKFEDEMSKIKGHLFRAEQIANDLNVEVSKVILAFHKLNLCGILQKRSRILPHDTNRDPSIASLGYGDITGWASNVYQFVVEQRKEDFTEYEVNPNNSPEGTLGVWDERDVEKRPRYSKRLGKRLEKV